MPTSNYSRPLSGDVMSSGSVWESHREEMIARRRGAAAQIVGYSVVHISWSTLTSISWSNRHSWANVVRDPGVGAGICHKSEFLGGWFIFGVSDGINIPRSRPCGVVWRADYIMGARNAETDKSRDLHKDSLWIPFWEILFLLLYNANVEAYEIFLEIFYIIVTISSTLLWLQSCYREN